MTEEKESKATIKITLSARDALKRAGSKGDTYSDVILRLTGSLSPPEAEDKGKEGLR